MGRGEGSQGRVIRWLAHAFAWSLRFYLVCGLCLALIIRVAGGKFFYVIYSPILAGIIFMPALIRLARLGRRSTGGP